MIAFTHYWINKMVDATYRGQALPSLSNVYFSLHKVKGRRLNSTAYVLNDYVIPATDNGRIYKCTTAGTSAASAPTWPVTPGGTVTDGTAVWTEQSNAMIGTTPSLPAEVSGGAYARATEAASLVNFAGTQGAASVIASSGTSGVTSNNSTVDWTTPSADWTTGTEMLAVIGHWDASTSGNLIGVQIMTAPQQVPNGSAAPSAAAGQISIGFAAAA